MLAGAGFGTGGVLHGQQKFFIILYLYLTVQKFYQRYFSYYFKIS
jgi:hypothetical protein